VLDNPKPAKQGDGKKDGIGDEERVLVLIELAIENFHGLGRGLGHFDASGFGWSSFVG